MYVCIIHMSTLTLSNYWKRFLQIYILMLYRGGESYFCKLWCAHAILHRASHRVKYVRDICNWPIEIIRGDRPYLLNARELLYIRSNTFSLQLTHSYFTHRGGLSYSFFFFHVLIGSRKVNSHVAVCWKHGSKVVIIVWLFCTRVMFLNNIIGLSHESICVVFFCTYFCQFIFI